MNIGMILREEYPPDIRVDKEMRMLREGGHHLHLLCYGIDGRQEDERRDDGVIVRYIQPHKRRWQRRLDNWRFCFLFRNVLWENQITRFVQDFALQALHVHDLPLVGAAYHVAQQFGLPVVADLHENYPSAVQNYYGSPLRKAVLYNHGRWTRYETRMCKAVARVLCVVKESRELLGQHGVPLEQIVIVPNVTPPDWSKSPVDQEIIDRYRDRFVISYIGGFGYHRGVDVAIEAMHAVKQQIPQALLLLAGRGAPWFMVDFERWISDPQVADVIDFVGWRPLAEVPSLIQASDICLVPHNTGTQTHASAPHKLFQYWMLGKPVVVSNCRSLQRIAQESRGAAVFEAENAEDLARVLIELYRDDERRKQLGANGYAMAMNGEYSWKETSETLNQVYCELSPASWRAAVR